MLHDLLGEMARNGLRNKDIAELLNFNEKTIYNKIHGFSDFDLNEAIKIRDEFFAGMELKYLFKKTK